MVDFDLDLSLGHWATRLVSHCSRAAGGAIGWIIYHYPLCERVFARRPPGGYAALVAMVHMDLSGLFSAICGWLVTTSDHKIYESLISAWLYWEFILALGGQFSV